MKSSIHFAKATSHAMSHNFRKDIPSYLLPIQFQQKNEYWSNSITERELFSRSALLQKTGKKPIFENSRWEAVMNFNNHHDLNDVLKAVQHIEKKFNITCSAVAMHRDEGHIDDEGIVKYNFHAHLNFITHKDGKQNWRKEFIKPNQLRELQSEIAEIMQMERGQVNSKSVRLEHRQYKAQVQLEASISKENKATIEQLKDEIKELREQLKAQGAVRADYAVLEQLNKDLKAQIEAKSISEQELQIKLSNFAVQHKKVVEEENKQEISEINAIVEPLLIENNIDTSSKYTIKAIFNFLIIKIKELTSQNKRLNEENTRMYKYMKENDLNGNYDQINDSFEPHKSSINRNRR